MLENSKKAKDMLMQIFYNEIWNIDDWKAFKKVGNQNYKLMADLDFKNEVANTYAGISLNGIFDGNNHTLQILI